MCVHVEGSGADMYFLPWGDSQDRVQQQDEALDRLHSSVMRLHDVGVGIGAELDKQAP